MVKLLYGAGPRLMECIRLRVGEKDFKKEIDELMRENILLTKPTSYGTRYSLNPRMKEEVTRILLR